MEYVKLNNGVMMPQLGLGTFLSNNPEECEQSIIDALDAGYRLIDTAQGYGNEAYIGRGLKRSGVDRKEVFLTTKVWFRNHNCCRESLEQSMRDLQTDYLDLVLIHWPFGDVYAAWRDLEAMYEEGKIRAIGVSNFNTDRLQDLVNFNRIVPAVNQIETNLQSMQSENRAWMRKLGVQHMGYAPFGQGKLNDLYSDAAICAIAQRVGKTPRQVALRYQLQEGVVVIPKSVNADRMKENIDVFDFELLDNEMEILRTFNKNQPLIGNPQNAALVESSVNW